MEKVTRTEPLTLADEADPRAPTVAILGHVGNRNLGDEALIASVIQGLRERIPHLRIVAYTLRPDDTRSRHDIPAYPLRGAGGTASSPGKPALSVPATGGREGRLKAAVKRVPAIHGAARRLMGVAATLRDAVRELCWLPRDFRRTRGVDLLVIAGSQQLIDYIDGPWSHLYNLYKWSLLARLRGARVALVSCGAGPIGSRLGTRFARRVLAMASYRSFRDRESIEVVERLRAGGDNRLAPDLAYFLRPPAAPRLYAGTLDPRVVAINPVPFKDSNYWVGGSPEYYRHYVESLAAFAAWLAARGRQVVFFATQLNLDAPVIADTMEALRESGQEAAMTSGRIAVADVDSLDSLFAVLERSDVVVASRFHGAVLALTLPRPVLGIAYHVKTRQAMEQLGLEGFSIDIKAISLQGLIECFERLVAGWSNHVPEVERQLARHREVLGRQFDALAALAHHRFEAAR